MDRERPLHRPSKARVIACVAAGIGIANGLAVASASATPLDYPVWGVTRVSSAPDARGRWSDCATLRAGGRDATVTCSRSFAVANTISASLGISYKQLNATLGYGVTETVTLTGGGSFTVKKHQRRTIQWAPRYTVKHVESTRFICPWKALPPSKACRVRSKEKRSATAKRAAGIEYRLVR